MESKTRDELKMIAYHGTRVNRKIIEEEGLKRPNYEKLIDRTLAKYGYTREDVPERIWKSELYYRWEEYKEFSPEFQPYIAFTLSYEQAKNYGGMGGEFEYLIIYNLFLWKLADKEGNISRNNIEEARSKAIEGKESVKVITVDIPKKFIPRGILDRIKRIKSVGYDPYDKGSAWNIPVFIDIPPDWIVKIDDFGERESEKYLT